MDEKFVKEGKEVLDKTEEQSNSELIISTWARQSLSKAWPRVRMA